MKSPKFVAVVFLLAMFLIGFTFAWIEYVETLPITIHPGDYEIELRVYLDDVEVTSSSPYYDSETGLLTLNAFDEDADNYIGKLRIWTSVHVHNASRIRFRLYDQWELRRIFFVGGETRNVVPYALIDEGVATSPYFIHSDYFRKGSDPFYYYDGLLAKDESRSWNLIDGATGFDERTTLNYTEEVYVSLMVQVEIVQANRIVKVWGLTPDWFE
jgi:hypothetical protein